MSRALSNIFELAGAAGSRAAVTEAQRHRRARKERLAHITSGAYRAANVEPPTVPDSGGLTLSRCRSLLRWDKQPESIELFEGAERLENFYLRNLPH